MGNRASEEKIEPRVTIGGRDSAYEEYRQEIMKEIDRISKEAGNDPVKVKGIFARALEVENISEVTAAMYYLAHRKQLQDILRQNASWLRATKEFVSRHYSDQRADIYIEKTKNFYSKYGNKTIVISRFMPIVRTFAPFVAGIAKMDYKKFLSYNILGSFLWVTIFLSLGFFFGNIPFVKQHFSIVVFGIVFISIIPAIVEFIRYKFSNKN